MRTPLMGLRVQRFLTQKQRAEALGVTETTIRNWEAGRSVPKLTPVQFLKTLNNPTENIDEEQTQ